MKTRFNLFGMLGLGALLMYIFDPQVGRRRRAVARDKMNRFTHKTLDAIDVTSRDLKNRVTGLAAEAKRLISTKEVSDERLAERVRSKLGAFVSHPSSIDVKVENGKVILSGPILTAEVDRLINYISSMWHVKGVENRLEVHESAGSIPGLQGQPGPRKTGETPDLMQVNWSPTTRFIAGTFGGTLALYGARQLNILGTAVATLGAAIFARALTNMEFKRLTGIGAGRRAINFHKIINVAAPVEEVFSFWRNYENFPRFMSNVREVRETGESRSHWVVAGPAAVPVEWDAVVTNYLPNRSIGWKTLPGSPIEHAGIVTFQPNPDGTTRVEVKMSYNPVAGALGHVIASIFGADPKRETDADLMRMKSMIETRVPPHDAARKDQSAYIH
jgi:uncharacterized membrane protein